ncbi:hypothetical protein Tco_1128787 [Tanacetum coccineum]
MNPQEKQQVAACDDKWVPFSERVKLSSTNIRLETTVPQKEETFQVVIDFVKNSTCFKAFTIFADVPKIFMQQFWYSIKKVQGTDSYEFLLANKKCIVNAEAFRKILDIYLRVEGVNFIDVPDDDIALTFLIDHGYKGPLYKNTNMFVDHMHQPWRNLAAIINKFLSGKTTSNDKLRKFRIDILWGMFKRETVDYPELIWEDIAYQIDHMKEKKSRRENMPYPRFTKILPETTQEYGLPIPETMLTNAIKQSESYQMFIKYSTSQIRPKKSRGKGSQGKKIAGDSQKTVDVSKDFEPEPEPLAKSISQTEAEEAKAARKVHATHARIVTESVPESAKKKSGGRSSKIVVIQDTPSTLKSKPATSKTKLKGAPSLTPQEQEAADIMQALKESKKTCRRQPGTEGSNEGTGSKPWVPNESRVVFATSSEGTGAKPRVLDEDKDITEEKDDKDGDADDEGDDHVSNTQDADDEDVKTESDEDEIYKYKIRVRKDQDVEMKDAEVEESDKGFGDQFLKLSSDSSLVSTIKDSVDTYVSSLLDIPIQQVTPQTQSPSVQKVPVLVIPETTNLPPIPEIITETPVSTVAPSPQVTPIISIVQQTPRPILTQPITTDASTITTVVPESNALTAIELRVAKLEKDMSELKTVDHSFEALVVLQSQVLTVVDSYLDTKVGDHLPELTKKPTPIAEQESEKSPSDILKIKKE